MTFSRANSLGWALFEDLTSAQMNIIDLNQSRAVDGTFGGTYNLSAPLTFNGTMTVTNMNITNASITNAYFSAIGTFTAGTIGCNTLNCALAFNCSGDANFNYYTFFKDDVRMTAGSFFFSSGESMTVNDGLFVVTTDGYARFDTEVEFSATSVTTFVASSTLKLYGNVQFYAGGTLSVSGFATFYSRPWFIDGITLSADELINYNTEQSFVVRWPWALGTSPGGLSTTHFKFDSDWRGWVQRDNATTPPHFWTQIQGLWGGTAVTIVSAEFRARAYNLSGAVTGDTNYHLKLMDQDGVISSTLGTAIDTDANSSTSHGCSTLTINAAYDPSSYYLGVVFYGYNGGDTLSDSKLYILETIKLNLKTAAKGVY